MSERMKKYFQELHLAEFGNDDEGIESSPQEVIKLLKRALKWKTHSSLEEVCIYLGAETDERINTIEGCKSIIKEDIKCWTKRI